MAAAICKVMLQTGPTEAAGEGVARITCIEVGGSGTQTVSFDADGAPSISSGATARAGDIVGVAVPGIVRDGRVVAASNLGWYDVDPAEQLGLPSPAHTVLNDGEASALGEAAIRNVDHLAFVGLGTGVGGAVVRAGQVVAENLFGHAVGFSDRPCQCPQTGCLETVAAGWALPSPLSEDDVEAVAGALARAIHEEPAADVELLVIGGGLAGRYPRIVHAVAERLPSRTVEGSAAPPAAKSAAAWGLRRAMLGSGVMQS